MITVTVNECKCHFYSSKLIKDGCRLHINCWVLYTSSVKLLESDVSISLPPGLCNRAVHTAAGHSEGKTGVDLPPL